MAAPRLHDVLPALVDDGIISPEQAERIRARHPAPERDGGDRTIALFGILGALLIGLGVVLVVAHNWNELPRTARTVVAFLPVLIGQALVWHTLRRKMAVTAWREGGAIFLACALCAAVALISQIYHIEGDLEGYLLVCAVLMLPLLYLPGSVVVLLGFLAMATWYGCSVRWGWSHAGERPWALLPLLVAAVPAYGRLAVDAGRGRGFWWASLAMALSVLIGAHLFHGEWTSFHALGLIGLAAAFTLVPWMHRDPGLRTWPWALVGGTAVLIVLYVFSFRGAWTALAGGHVRLPTLDVALIAAYTGLGLAAYVLTRHRRAPLERWPYPEALPFFLLCTLAALVSTLAATVLVNLGMLAVGVRTVMHGQQKDSLRRMNLGLLIISLTIMARFFDTALGFFVRGLVFIAIGCAFLYMNLRMVRRRKARPHEA